MARPSDYRAEYRKNTRNRQKKENKFYTKVNNGDILNKRLPDIDEIKQNIEAEQARAQEYENEWLDSVVNNPAAEQKKPAAISGAAGSAKGRQIMQLQDTLVHNPGMSDAEKSTLQEKINNLTAEKEVLDWKDANPGTPTVENYEAQKGYYDRLWQQNQDAIVNGLGNGTIKQGSDEWYELFKKGDDLLAMKDAYNRGMMGQLDGDKAQSAEEQVTAGGEQGQAGNIKPYPWLPDEKDENSEDTIKTYPWSPDNNEDNLGDKIEPYSVSSNEEENEERANQNNRKEFTEKIDSELQNMHPDYIPDSVEVIKGPTEGKGRPGWNEFIDGLTKIGGEIPIVDKIVKALDLIMPDIPESNYECYLISADFNSQDNIENEIFQLIKYEDGKLKTLRYDGDMVTEN